MCYSIQLERGVYMNTFIKKIKNNNGTMDKIFASSNDDYGIMIGSNYKLIKFYDGKKSFKDTLLGSDIGIHSHGFVNVAIISTLLAIGAFITMYLSFRI